jgi:hypothetical protein
MGQGYMLCEDCYTLAGLTSDVTLN